MTFLKMIYYIMGILFAYYKNKNFKNLPRFIQTSIQNSEKPDQYVDLNEKIEGFTEEQKNLLNGFLFLIWMIIGMFTFQWILYVILLYVTIIIEKIAKYYSKNFKMRLRIAQFYYVITWFFCWVVTYNAYISCLSSDDIIKSVTNYVK